MFASNCNNTSTKKTVSCIVNLCQVIFTSFSCFLLFSGGLFLLIKFRKRYFSVLLSFHNMRSASELLLVIVGTLELASASLPSIQNNVSQYAGIPFRTANAVLAVTVATTLIVYHRIVEIKNCTAFLYHSVLVSAITSIFRAYKLIEVLQRYEIYHLEAFIQIASLSLLFTLASLDGFTIYKERYTSRREDDCTDDTIGYRHTVATFLSKILFWWLTPLLWRGYNDPLEQCYIGKLRDEDSARSHYDQFLFIYKTTKVKTAQLWLCYLKSSWRLFLLGGLLKLLGDLSALVGPLSVYQIIEYIQQQYTTLQDQDKVETAGRNVVIRHFGAIKYYPDWKELLSNGWVIAWVVLLSSLAQGGLSQASTHVVNMIGIRIKTSIQGLVYRKTLLLSSSCLYNPNQIATISPSMTVKEVGGITNLMSEDAINVMTFFWIAHYVWSIPLKVGLVMYLLYRKLGISAIIGSLVCIMTMIPLQFLIGKAMSNNAEKAAKCTDERLKKTGDIFLGIKLIKLNAWENVFQDKITSSRNRELIYLNRDSIYWFIMSKFFGSTRITFD